MEVKVWTNSRKGAANATFGLGVSIYNRKRFFNALSPTVSIDVDGQIVAKKLPECFWNNCIHICDQEISEFIKRNGLSSWPHRKPPILILKHISEQNFRLLIKEEN